MVAEPAPSPQPGLEDRARAILAAHWRAEGYTCPNPERYPWQWLWDSCFHAIVWATAGDDRAVEELRACFAGQLTSGFVPHMGYPSDPTHHSSFWGRVGWSSITQPPMFGHAIAVLAANGMELPPDVVERATAGLRFLLGVRRRSPAGLVEIVHPWESGADDSPRWDDLVGGASVDAATRRKIKGDLLAAVSRDAEGAATSNKAFAVGSASFTALVAFNCRELAAVTGDDGLRAGADELAEALSARWDPELVTWVDDGPTAAGSGRARSLEALSAVLVDPAAAHVDAALDSLVDEEAHGAFYGPTGVHRGEPSFRADGYWRGPAWPQLTYLMWVAAGRRAAPQVREQLAESLVEGARRSGFAEYWHPDTGEAGGAVPQSWSTLAWVVASA